MENIINVHEMTRKRRGCYIHLAKINEFCFGCVEHEKSLYIQEQWDPVNEDNAYFLSFAVSEYSSLLLQFGE